MACAGKTLRSLLSVGRPAGSQLTSHVMLSEKPAKAEELRHLDTEYLENLSVGSYMENLLIKMKGCLASSYLFFPDIIFVKFWLYFIFLCSRDRKGERELKMGIRAL